MLEVKMLGQFDIRWDGSPVNIPTLPAKFLFAYLLLNQEYPQSREKMAALFWPDSSETNARTSLRQALWRIRKAFELHQLHGSQILTTDDLFVSISPDADICLDTAILNKAAESVDELVQSVSVYEGELLPDCFDDWIVGDREYYQVLFAQKMQKLVDRLVEEQCWSEVVPWAERWITLGQTPEPAYRALMYAHAGLGDVSQVAIVYQRCKKALWRELGVEPSEHTTDLRDRLVKGKSSLTRGYELRELIGKSETSEVYRGYQPLLNREVAIKVITSRYANLPDFIRRFESEAQLIARLEHIHIRSLHDYWRDPGGAYLVMRWLNGGNLGTILQQGALPLEAVVRLIDQAASALTAAHQRGIVHGQLKPDNILFDDERNAYLSDFRIALDRGVDSGGIAAISGFHYLAPEQTRGEPPTELSDQYSLALILLEALSGQHPFIDQNFTSHEPGESPFSPAQPSAHPRQVRQVFDKALAEIPSERFPDVMAMASALRHALVAELPITSSDGFEPAPILEVTNPYKGLRAFQEADAADFYGREASINRILDRLRQPVETARFLALVGPSGCGKSSVIQAGLLPALRHGDLPGSESWYVVEMSPGTHPLANLEIDLLHIATHKPPEFSEQLRQNELGLLKAAQQVLPDLDSELLVIIDHFEELFTLVEDKGEVDHFLNILTSAVMDPQSAVRVIISLRADFYDRPLMHLAFGDLIRQRTEVVTPMSAEELWQAVVSPAERAGLTFEPGLPTTIVSEVMERPSALPLFQYALTELFEQREDHLLTRNAYESIGGVAKALARRAEVVYGCLTVRERAAAKQVFLRLVNPEDGNGVALRREPLSELVSMIASTTLVEADDLDHLDVWSLNDAGIPADIPSEYQKIQIDAEAINIVLQEFGRSRLFTFDHDPATREPTVEVAHDALLREWSRLRTWLDDSRSDIRMQRLLAHSAKEWLNAGHDPSYLLHGKRLEQLQIWAETTTLLMNLDEQAFLDTSLEVRQHQQDDESARQQLELKLIRQHRRRDRILGLVGIATLLLIGTAVILFRIAHDQTKSALSRQLAAQCLSSKNNQFDLALLLCLEARRFADTFEARDALATLYSENPQHSRYLHGHQSAVTDVAFSQDSSLLASGGADGSIFMWDLTSGEAVGSDQIGQTGAILDLAFGAGNATLASAGADGQVILLQIASGESYQLPASTETVTSLAVSSDGKTLALGTLDGRILFWDIPSRKPTGDEFQGHIGPVEVLNFSPDGLALASAGLDNSVLVWDLTTANSRSLIDHAGTVLALDFSPDGRFLASSSANGSIFISDLTNEQITSKLLDNSSRVDALAFSPDGAQLASGFIDGKITLWDVATGLPSVQGLIGHNGAVMDIAYSPNGKTLASSSADRDIILRNVASNQDVHLNAISGVSFQPDGLGLATGSVDGSVQFWDLDFQNDIVPPYKGQDEGVNDVAFSPDGHYVASAGRDGTVALIDAASGVETAILSGHEALVTSVAFSPDGKKLASGGADNTVILWDTATRKPSGLPLVGHEDVISSLTFAPDGKLLASASHDNEIILWDVETGNAIGTPLEEHKDWVYSLAFSPDGQWLASGGADNLAYLWDLTKNPVTGKPLMGHSGYIFDVSFSRDSELLFTGGADGTIRTWDVETASPIGQPLKAHMGAVYSLDLSADGEWMASGGHDAAVRLWRTNMASWACEGVGRNLTRTEWEAALQEQTLRRSNLLDLSYHQTCQQWPAGE